MLSTELGLWSFLKVGYFVGQIWYITSEHISIGKDNEMITTYELERMEEKEIMVCFKIP
jgi:hypothetical protein